MELALSLLAITAVVGFARMLGATRRSDGSTAKGILAHLAQLRNVPPVPDKLVDAEGLEVEERGFKVIAAVGTKDSFWEARVAVRSPGLPPFTVECGGLVHTTIQCADPGLRALLETWLRQHRSELSDVTIRAFPTVLVLRRPGAQRQLSSVSRFDADIRLAVDIARLDMFGLELLKELPGATYHFGDEPYVTLHGPGDIRIGIRRTDDGARTYMRTAYAEDPPAAEKLAELGAQRDDGRSHVTLIWPSIQHDPKRIEAAIELLRSLRRAPSDGAYR